jgi:hypothetical protein
VHPVALKNSPQAAEQALRVSPLMKPIGACLKNR